MFSSILRRLIIYFTLLMLVASCGEPVPVDCTPDEEQCTTETEGGFETGTVAGIAAGGAAVVALAAGGLSSDDGGSGSSGASSSNTNNDGSASNSGPILTGTLIDSVVSGVSYQSTSNLSGLTSSNGRFSYRSGDQVSFQIGDTILGTVTGGAVITPVELAGVSNTADRRVINIARLLQSLDEDQDPSNGISINATTRAAMLGRNLSFDVPISSFSANENTVLAVTGNSLVASNDAINHLHGSLVEEGRPGSVATETAIQQLVPSFVAETSGGQKGATGQSCDFAGGTVPDGGNVIAYQSESVEAGSTCSSQTRFCDNGQLSGSYAYITCQVEEVADCQFNGNSIADGVSTTAYQTATVPFGSTCTSQTRTCSNGTLSGSYTFSKCDEAEPLDCTFNGSVVDHGDSIKAYQEVSVNSGASCISENRVCGNGVLSGSYSFGTCAVKSNNRWTQQLGTSLDESGNAITSDAEGNIYVTGNTNGELDGNSNNGGWDIFLVKFNSEGQKQWTRQLGTSSEDRGLGVTSDSNGNIYLTGFTSGGLDGNSNAGSGDFILIKYNSSGNRLWTKQLGSSMNDRGSDVTFDSSNNLYVTGWTSGNFDGGINSGGNDIFIIKFDSNGIKQWSHQLGSSYEEFGKGIVVDSSKDLYITGWTTGDLGSFKNIGVPDYFLIKFNSSGNKLWTKQFGSVFTDYGNSVAVDKIDDVYLTGSSENNGGLHDLVIMRFDTNGNNLWSQQFGTNLDDRAYSITYEKNQGLYITGYTEDELDGNNSAGRSDIFIVKYNTDGTKQ